MDKIKIGIVGVGNCTSSLLQGIEYYKNKNSDDITGLMHWDINGYKPYDIEVELRSISTKEKLERT
jgi:myo-inositol-1-phosphate synthase